MTTPPLTPFLIGATAALIPYLLGAVRRQAEWDAVAFSVILSPIVCYALYWGIWQLLGWWGVL